MLDSDSDIEIVEPARPSAAAAAVARSASLHPTSPSVADPNLEPRPLQPVASSSKAPYTAGAWAPKSRDKPPSSSSSSSAPGGDSALASKTRNSLGGTGGGSKPAGGAGKEMNAVQKAQSGADIKGKGRADVIVLSSDNDEDEDEPLVVHRRPPRASLPSLPTISSTAKPKPSFRRHSLAHPKPAPKSVQTLSRPNRDDSSDSSEPDPLAMRSSSSPSKSSPGKKKKNKKKKDRTAAPTDEAGKGGEGDGSTISGQSSARPGHVVARKSTLPQSHRRPTTPSSSTSSSSSAVSTAAPLPMAFKQPRPLSSTTDAAQQGGGGDKTKVSRPERAPIKRGPARKSTLDRPAAVVLSSPAEADSAAARTPTSAKESLSSSSLSSLLPPQEPAASKPPEDSSPTETRDNAKVRPSTSSSAAAAASIKAAAAAASQPRSHTSTKPSEAGLASSVSEHGLPSSSYSAAAAQSSAAARAPSKTASRLPASVATAPPPPSARRPKAPPLVVATARAHGSKASSPEKTPSSAEAGRDPSTSAKKAEQPKQPPPTSTASSWIGSKSSSGAGMAARSTPPPPTAKPDSTTASKSPTGSRLPAAVRNRSPLRAASKGVSPARSSSNVNMDVDVDARPESSRKIELVSQKGAAPMSTSQAEMDDSDSDIEFITPAPKPKPVPVSNRAAHMAPTGDELARLDHTKTAAVGKVEVGKPAVESLTEAVMLAQLDGDKVEGADKAAQKEDEDDRAADEKRPAGALWNDRDGEDVEMADSDGDNKAADDLAANTGSDKPQHVADAQSNTSSPGGETAAAVQAERMSPTVKVAGEAASKRSPTAPSAIDSEPAAQPEQTQADRVEEGKTATTGLSPPEGDVVCGIQDVTMRDVPLVRRDLERIASPATSTSSPPHSPAPGDSAVPSRRIYGRGHKSTGGRPVKKGVNRVRAVESDESAAHAVEASAQAFKTLAVAKQSVTSVAPPRLREDSDMAAASDHNEMDDMSSASDSSGSSSFRLQQALLPNRPPSRASDALTESDRLSPASKTPLASELSRFSQDPKGRDQITLETTLKVGRREEFVGPKSRRQDYSDLQGQDSSSSSTTTTEKRSKHSGIGRKSSGPWDKRKPQYKTFDSVVPLGPSVAISASDPPDQASHPMELDEKTDSGSATERLSKSSIVDRPLKRERAAAADSSQFGPAWAIMSQKMHESKLPLLLMPADIDPDDPYVLEEQRDLIRKFKHEQKLEQPWARQIAGPSYDFLDEFRTDIQDTVNRREAKWAKLHPDELPIRSSYKVMFEQMIAEALATEYGPADPASRPQIRVCPPKDLPREAMTSPPFDFIYTNRVVYDDEIVPVQAPGCGCEGNCDTPANRKTCSCLARQIKACETKGIDRSDHQDFAYDRSGKLKPAVFDTLDEVIECNSQCGCGPECINRVVGKRQGISVDLFWTGIAGWGARLPMSYPSTPLRRAYSQRVIQKGEPLAVYAGELMRCKDAYEREDNVYSRIHRNYIFDLDAWTVLEDIESLLPPSQTKKLAEQAPPNDAQTASTHRSTGTKGRAKGKRQAEEKPFVKSDEPEDSGAKALFSIDAFSLGNWTRFCNHVCADWNVSIRPVYIDEADVARPLFVYFARRDIHPGEEITITYFGGEEEPSPRAVGLTNAEWKRYADETRNNAPKSQRCYCGKKYCRGRMFNVPDEKMFWDVD